MTKIKIYPKNKRAQIFTLIAIALIGLMFLSFEIYSFVDERQQIKTRISTMESFLDSIELNLQRQIFISGFRIIFLAEDEITSKGNYILDIDAFFDEAFFQGTVNGVDSEIMLGATYSDLIDDINEKASKINVEATLSNPVILVEQEDPWHVKFTLTSDFTLKDKSDLARWEKTQVISAYIPVSNFEDPAYIINTNALVSKKINQTIYEGIYAQGGDVSNLLSHINDDYYAANADAPNFLQRLEGDLTADAGGNGVESFVNTNELSQQGLPIYDKSKIDYIYFSASNPSHCYVSGMPSWFTVDLAHLTKYNVTCG